VRALVRIACVFGVALVWSGAAHAATFTVTTTDDGDHGSCGATCTLRDAVKAVNPNAGADTIE
jgi:CSLREA domain-containing protein